jgi:hypothetical protein
MRPMWRALYDAGADVVLSGHDHNYESFAPQDASGAADPRGIREFVVGTGGGSHEAFGTVKPNSLVRNSDTFGIFELTLHATSYDWQFVPVQGKTFTDSGTGACVTSTPPPPPGNLLTNASFETDANGDGRPDGWTSTAKFTRSTAVTAHQGNYVGQHQAVDPTTTSYTVGQIVKNLTAGATYDFSGWVDIPPTTDTFSFTLQVAWRDASNAVLSKPVIRTFTGTNQGVWEQVQAALVAPAGATNAQVKMVVKGLAATVYVDEFSFQRR